MRRPIEPKDWNAGGLRKNLIRQIGPARAFRDCRRKLPEGNWHHPARPRWSAQQSCWPGAGRGGAKNGASTSIARLRRLGNHPRRECSRTAEGG